MNIKKLRALLLLIFVLLAPVGIAACGETGIEGEVIHGEHDDTHGADDAHADDEGDTHDDSATAESDAEHD